ncbi:MAG TPA: tRNA lysidine(34) synthetase TilS [Nitrospira sp.]|nr:tRNA lysidine(34) synthetase TilS [Nitrospira sp.]
MTTQAARRGGPRLLKEVTALVRRRALFDKGQHLLVAVSGGPDSTALLVLLIRLASRWALRLTAVHVNHGLRGNESDGDEKFVSDFCKARQIPLVVLRPPLRKQRGRTSIQEAARLARYRGMKQLAADIGADRIVLGHTANDQVETMLMWMLRGAGLSGLSGMPFIREGLIVRPLLACTKDALLAFLDEEHLAYRNDSSNAMGRYHRNRLRSELWPVVAGMAPAAIKILQRQADLLCEDERHLDHLAQQEWARLVTVRDGGGCRLDRPGFAALSIAMQRRVLRMLLQRHHSEGRAASLNVVEMARRFCLTGRPSSSLQLGSMVLMSAGDAITGDAPTPSIPDPVELIVPVTVPSTVRWPRTGAQFRVQLLGRLEAESLLGQRAKSVGIFDADRASAPLHLRTWRPGDRMCPAGMEGKSKKLQDLFTDSKIAGRERERFPVLEGPQGILWVAGLRQDQRFRVRADSTRCLVVTITDRMEEGAG